MSKLRVFLSYRRDDSCAHVGRVADYLENRFGRASVFKDVDSILPGADFRRVLEYELTGCDVVLVVIGDDWFTATDEQGRLRLENKNDFVRAEVELALARQIPIIPVL